MIIREEAPSDASTVRRVTELAFGQPSEADLVEALQASGDAALSLVAEDGGEIVGHMLFSRLQAPDRCLALAPVSVTPGRQHQGIGSALVREGLARAKRDGWRAVFVLGEPDYYRRFGFDTATTAAFETTYPKAYLMALELAPNALRGWTGAVLYAPPFSAAD